MYPITLKNKVTDERARAEKGWGGGLKKYIVKPKFRDDSKGEINVPLGYN